MRFRDAGLASSLPVGVNAESGEKEKYRKGSDYATFLNGCMVQV